MKKEIFTLHTAVYFLLHFGGFVSDSDVKHYDGNCVRNISCMDVISCIGKSEISENDPEYKKCRHSSSIYYNNRYYAPVNFIYQLNDNFEKFYEIMQSSYTIKKIVTILDFSENQLNYQPNINYDMEILKKINLSHNNILKAVLYNDNYELNSLIEIDFSYNVIRSIEINENRHVFNKLNKINLSYNDLVEITDHIFKSFDDLQYLDLSNNKISGITSNTFEGISSLKYLDLSFNNITDINTSFFRFNNLIDLNLSNNRILKIDANNLDNLNELQCLDLSNNLISTVDVFDNLSRLIKIDLSRNKLQRLASNLFTATIYLENINFSYNNITHIPKNMFLKKNISMFSIKGNDLTGSLERGFFEGLHSITDLDLSHQNVTSIGDYTFFGLIKVTKLLLNNNFINVLSSKSFSSLRKLVLLDLSYNRITNLDFEKSDLGNLKSLAFSNNLVEKINVDHLFNLHQLQYLDLSQNNITQLQPKSFQTLTSLDNVLLSKNPLTGSLEENTFDGLYSIPLLDLSGTSLNLIKNNSFDGMMHLYDLNISHSKIAEVQYNSFLNTENIETVDLSYNNLENFAVNTSHLKSLKNLRLDNNIIKALSQSFVRGLFVLNKINLSHNKLLTLHSDTFHDQKLLNYLDLSFNLNFKLDFSLLRYTNHLDILKLSGTINNITFKEMQEMPLTQLDISNSNILNVSFLSLQKVKDIQILLLSNNSITQIEFGAFSKLSSIKEIDMSYNSIKSIEPGVFKDCHQLQALNISHNKLSEIRYGIFKGLVHLNILDISYNYIINLETARLYDLQDLSELLVDHNRINKVSVEDLSGTRISTISIGDNPLPCESLIELMKYGAPILHVTSILHIDSKDDNHKGIRCNYNKHIPNQRIVKTEKNTNNETISKELLIDIRDILLNISSTNIQSNDKDIINNKHEFEKSVQSLSNNIINLNNISLNIEKENRNTNQYLERLLKLVAATNSFRLEVSRQEGNMKNNSNKSEIDKLKLEIDNNIVIEKEKILADVGDKLAIINQRINSLIPSSTVAPVSEHSTLSKETKSSVFIETCIVLILIILVCFVLYKVYKSRCYVVSRWSASTRQISEMENSNL